MFTEYFYQDGIQYGRLITAKGKSKDINIVTYMEDIDCTIDEFLECIKDKDFDVVRKLLKIYKLELLI